jgi:hypothetical protein
MTPSEMPQCPHCEASWSSALAAATCCDPDPQPR